MELKKSVPKATIEKHVLSNVRSYQDTIPRYRVVSDWFGNQYYVENKVDQETIFNDVLRSIDWNQLGKSISRKLFSDYKIELKHDGKELKVSSKKDEIDQIFELDEEVDDVEVTKICLTEDMNDAVLGLRLIKKVTVEEPVRSVDCHSDEDQPTSNDILMTEDCDSREEPEEESKEEPKEEPKEEQVEEPKKEHKKRHRHRHHRHHHHHRRSESLSNDESLKQDQAVSSPNKESLLASEPKGTNGTYKIDIDFKDLQDASRESDSGSEEFVRKESQIADDNNKPQISRRGSSSSSGSVVLEEVEDEEHKRWQRSLSASPSGHSVLEDV